MNPIRALASGLAGAATLALLHETLRRSQPDALGMDLLGGRTIERAVRALGRPTPHGTALRALARGGDVVSNAIYYAAVAHGPPAEALRRGALLGLAAGVAGAVLPGRMGSGDDAGTRTAATRMLTVGLYVAGGFAAALAYSLLGADRSAE